MFLQLGCRWRVACFKNKIIRIPIDNGRDPVGIYSSKRFFKPPSEVHSFRTDDRDLTTHDSLNNGFPELLLFVTGLMLAL